MKVKLINSVKYEGKTYIPNDVIDITEKEVALNLIKNKQAIKIDQTAKIVKSDPNITDDLTKIKDIGDELSYVLNGMGYTTFEKLATADVEEIIKIHGISEKNAKKILKESLKFSKEK